MLRVRDLVINRDAGTTHRGDRELALTYIEFQVLCELASNPGWVVSRSQLLERVWGYDFFGDERLVDGHIGRLRLKVEDDPSKPTLIVTVRGLGYKLRP